DFVSITGRIDATELTLGNRSHTAMVARTGGAWDDQVREPGPVVYDESTGTYTMPYSGTAPSGDVSIGIATATDVEGIWTKSLANPVVALGEDPYIAINADGTVFMDGDGLYHMFSESKTAGDRWSQYGINHHTSPDLHTWTADP